MKPMLPMGKVRKLREDLKAMAATTRRTPGQLISDTTLSRTVDVHVALGDTDALKCFSTLPEAKHHPNMLKNPSTTANLTADEEWTITGEDDLSSFIFDDNGADNRICMLLFGADTILQHLARADDWMMDGTFDVAPHIFAVLYVIHASLDSEFFICLTR